MKNDLLNCIFNFVIVFNKISLFIKKKNEDTKLFKLKHAIKSQTFMFNNNMQEIENKLSQKTF